MRKSPSESKSRPALSATVNDVLRAAGPNLKACRLALLLAFPLCSSLLVLTSAFSAPVSGPIQLSPLNGGSNLDAVGVNAAGDVVVGGATDGSAGDILNAFRWTQAGGIVSLGMLNGGSYSQATGVNALGDVVVGFSADGNAGDASRAFRWTQASGMVSLGVLNGGYYSHAAAVNAVGDVVVGEASDGNDWGIIRAFRWTQTDGMVSLGTFNGGSGSHASAVNAVGDVVVGYARDGSVGDATRAFRWTQADGMVSLGVLNGGSNSYAYAVNAAGDVVVGSAADGNAGNATRAFRWTQVSGMQSIAQWLAANGVVVTGANMVSAAGVNTDGSVVVGRLDNNHSYIARVSSVGKGVIDMTDFYGSLSASNPQRQLSSMAGRVFDGLSGAPMRSTMVTPGYRNMWASGDYGRNNYSDINGRSGAFELGFTYGIADGLVGQLAMGQAADRNDTKHGGKMTVKTTYLAPNLIYRLADTKLLLSAMAYYGSGRADVSRAYLNAGTAVISSGSPNAASMALRLRADMVDAFAVGPMLMTPYVSLTALRSTVDGYTEVGGGFPVQWNANKANTKVARVGMDAVWPVNDKFNALARLEYARNLQTTAAPVSGQIIGLQPFAWSDHRYQRDWLRLGLGGQYKIDSSTSIRSTINVTTQSDAPKLWLNLTFNKAF